MTTAANYIGLGPVGDIQELPANSRKYSYGYDPEGYIDGVAASGKARRQYKYKKKIDKISYETMKKTIADRIVYLYELESSLQLVIKDNGVLVEKEVQMDLGDIERYIVVGDGLVKNVTLKFREV